MSDLETELRAKIKGALEDPNADPKDLLRALNDFREYEEERFVAEARKVVLDWEQKYSLKGGQDKDTRGLDRLCRIYPFGLSVEYDLRIQRLLIRFGSVHSSSYVSGNNPLSDTLLDQTLGQCFGYLQTCLHRAEKEMKGYIKSLAYFEQYFQALVPANAE